MPSLTSRTGRRLRTTGILSKFQAGGGEVVPHSRLLPSQGSSGVWPGLEVKKVVLTKLTRNSSILMAIRKAPSDSMKLTVPQPLVAG